MSSPVSYSNLSGNPDSFKYIKRKNVSLSYLTVISHQNAKDLSNIQPGSSQYLLKKKKKNLQRDSTKMPQKIKSATVSTVPPSICHDMIGPDAIILVF